MEPFGFTAISRRVDIISFSYSAIAKSRKTTNAERRRQKIVSL